jgi:hypothetical protein
MGLPPRFSVGLDYAFGFFRPRSDNTYKSIDERNMRGLPGFGVYTYKET